MNKLGIAIDISHSGDQTSLDTIEASEKPIFITHAGARALWNTKRMKPDHVLKACADKGGVIGIEAAPHTTLTKKHPQHSIESFMQHFEYCANLLGIDHVAFGPDTLFGDHVALHHAFARQLSIRAAHGQPASRKSSSWTASRTRPKSSRTSSAGSSSTTTPTRTSTRSWAATSCACSKRSGGGSAGSARLPDPRTDGARPAGPGSPPVLRGACYCRAEGRLTCVAELTRLECDRRCAEEFCDDWFWLERRPCWNWGYGG